VGHLAAGSWRLRRHEVEESPGTAGQDAS